MDTSFSTLVLIVISALFVHITESCSSGWRKIDDNGHCYKLFDGLQVIRSWANAKRICELLHPNSSLSDIHGLYEQTLLADLLLKPLNVSEAWIGARLRYNTWKWINNTTLNPEDFCWFIGHDIDGHCGMPDVYDFFGSKYCLSITDEHGYINAYNCSAKLPFICKIKDGIQENEPVKPTSQPIAGTDDPFSTEVIVPAVIASLFMIGVIIICIVLIVVRRKKKNSPPAVISNIYEGLQRNDQSAEIEYSNLNVTGSHGHSTSGVMSHSAISNAVYSMDDHEYCSPVF